MAGFHQIWKLDLDDRSLSVHAGNGRERIIDGPLAQAELAQPSGITSDGETLYFADSETSSIRQASIDPLGSVSTLAGLDLFTFGDVDGTGDEIRLQHPIGIDMYLGDLLIADTYNNKIKKMCPETRACATVFGSGEPGLADGRGDDVRFHEPAGVSAYNAKLYIADTNNHAIRVADLVTSHVRTLEITGI